MRILTELIGGVVLLLVFFYGVNETIKFFEQRERQNDNVQPTQRQPDPDDAPGA
jgi:hypothetical protein